MEYEGPFEIPVAKILQFCNPYECCWINVDTPITKEEVKRAIEEEKGELKNTNLDWLKGRTKEARERHINKIAWFVVNGWDRPISLDVGVPSLGHHFDYIVDDGNHRFAAAIFRGDKNILADVGGELEFAEELGLIPRREKCTG